MVLPSTGGLDFEAALGREATYFALQPSNLSSPSSDEILGSRFLGEPSLEHDRAAGSGMFYYYWHKPCLTRKQIMVGGTILAGVLFTIILVGGIFSGARTMNEPDTVEELVPSDPELQPPPSGSKLRTFGRSAVCADGPPCALIGKTMLEKNGSAVDAALAALICNGLVNMQSMGFGGGFLMTIYKKKKNKAYVLNARDAAPNAANMHMFDGKPEYASRVDGLSITVPGELAGYWEAHQRFGKLPWAELFHPSIELWRIIVESRRSRRGSAAYRLQ